MKRTMGLIATCFALVAGGVVRTKTTAEEAAARPPRPMAASPRSRATASRSCPRGARR